MELNILNLFLVLLAAWSAGYLATRLGYPAVLGELAAGIILGPPLLGLLYGSEALKVLAEVGVLLMMLYIGMEIDPRELGKASKGGLLAAIGGFVVPFGLGYWAVVSFGGTSIAGVFVGMAMGVTSLATKSRILVDLRILDTRIAHVMMAGALVADTLSLIIFAGIISFATAGTLEIARIAIITVKVGLFFVTSWVLGLMVFPRLYHWLKAKGLTARTFNATLILLITLAFAELAHLAELHGILGAFIAGLLLREAIAERKLSHDLTELVKDVSLGFLAPIFFVTAGFMVSFGVFQTDLPLLLTVIVLATLGKIAGTALFYLPSGYGWREGITVGAGMNGRGAVEIVIAGIGLQAGIITQEIFSILVFMAIATTATVPVFLKWGVDWLRRRNELVRSSGGKNRVLIVGATPVGRLIAKELSARREVVLIDRNEENCKQAAGDGLKAILGDALDDVVLQDAGIGEVGMLIALTPNAAVNVLIAKRAYYEFLVAQLFVSLHPEDFERLQKQAQHIGAHTLFNKPVNVANWDFLLRQDEAKLRSIAISAANREQALQEMEDAQVLPLVIQRGGNLQMFVSRALVEDGDVIRALQAAVDKVESPK